MIYSRTPDTEVFFRGFGEPPPIDSEESIFESASRNTEDFAGQQMRSMAMSTVLSWLDEGDFTFEALDFLAAGMVDADGNEEIDEDEEQDYNELLAGIGDAFTRLGASAKNVTAFLDDEDDDQGSKLGKFLSKKLDNVSIDDNQLIARYATRVGSDSIFESTRKVVRNGKIVLKKKRVKKFRVSSAQRQALKKARRKSNTAAARRNRAKSMRTRKKRGL
jgi:hypothetical protein